MSNKRVDRLEVGADAPKSPNDEVVWIDVETNNINRYDESTNEWIGVGGTSGTFDDPILKDNVRFTNSNDDVRLRIEHGGTGVVRLHAPEDDLALRSARDILLYAGDDGPGNVYIGWGDATYTPDSTNRVATIADIQSGTTGDITFNGIQIIGDGTMELVPDATIQADQYLVIEPTGPNHIHVRAGGTIDDSAADLYIGGERANVVVSDYNRSVAISAPVLESTYTFMNQSESSGTQFITNNSTAIVLGSIVNVMGASYVVDSVTDNQPSEGLQTATATGAVFQTGTTYTFYEVSPNNNHNWYFSSNGYIGGPAMGGLFVYGLLNGENDLWLGSNDNVVLSPGSGSAFVGDINNPDNQIATIGDLGVYPVTEITASASFTVSFDHVGKTLYNVSGENVTCSVLLNANEYIPVGSEIKFVNDNSSGFFFDIADEGITLVGEGQGFSNVNIMFWLPSNGYATLLKVATDNWILSGIRVND